MSVISFLTVGRVSFLSDLVLKIYLYLEALSTTNKSCFAPPIPVLHPYPMSTFITSPKFDGIFTGSLFIFVLSIVAASPMSRIGFLSMVEMW